jgi:hypothetical protein
MMSDIQVKLQGLDNLVGTLSLEKMLKDNSSFSYTVYYEQDKANDLAELCDKYGSDKGSTKTSGHPYRWAPHTYADFIHARFGHCRNSIRRVFECGLGTNDPSLPSSMGVEGKPGASLRVWRDYFPEAQIFGADIDKAILFEEERIKTFHVDQTIKASIEEMWREIGLSDFDLMIDDGLHTYDAGISLFGSSVSKLGLSGHYIVEDVSPHDMLRYKSYFSRTSFRVEYVSLYRPKLPLGDNQLLVIRHGAKG